MERTLFSFFLRRAAGLCLCLSSLVLVSCSHTHTTTVRVVSLNGEIDKDVKIYADDFHQNNKYIGSGEAQYSSKKLYGILFDPVRLKKPGCLTMKKSLDLTEDTEKKKKFWLTYGLSVAVLAVSPVVGVVFDLYTTTVAMLGAGLLVSIFGHSRYGDYYTYKPVHNFEFACAKEAAQIIR